MSACIAGDTSLATITRARGVFQTDTFASKNYRNLGSLLIPAARLTPELRALVLEHKPELVRLLTEAANDAHHRPDPTPAPQGFDPGADALLALVSLR